VFSGGVSVDIYCDHSGEIMILRLTKADIYITSRDAMGVIVAIPNNDSMGTILRQSEARGFHAINATVTTQSAEENSGVQTAP